MSLRGGPDYGVWAPKHTVTALADMAELAARLGSINTFDRRGDTVWMDDFESPTLKVTPMFVGTGASVALSTEHARNGAQSLKLTTGNLAGDYALIYKYLPFPTLSKLGVEYSFSHVDFRAHYVIALALWDGTHVTEAVAKYDRRDETLRILLPNFVWATLATGLRLTHFRPLFFTFKLVYNPSQQRYVRLILNEQSFDLSAYHAPRFTSTDLPLLRAEGALTSDEAGNFSTYIADLIITQNEP